MDNYKKNEELLKDAAKNISVPNKAMVFESIKQKKEKKNYWWKVALPSIAAVFVCIVLLVVCVPKQNPDDTRYGWTGGLLNKSLDGDYETFYRMLKEENIDCVNFSNIIVSTYSLIVTPDENIVAGGRISGQDKEDADSDDLDYVYKIIFYSLAYDPTKEAFNVETEHKYTCGNVVINYDITVDKDSEDVLDFHATTVYKGVFYTIEYSSGKDDFTDFLDLIFKNA